MLERLQEHLDHTGQMPNTMYGFCKHLGKQDVLIQLKEDILVPASRHSPRAILIRDLKGAFDNAVSVLLERIEALHQQIRKLDDRIFDETADDLLDNETSDAGKYRDKVVNTAAALRFRLQDATRPSCSQTATTSKANLPQLELLKFDGNRRNWQRFPMQFASAVRNNDDLSTGDKFHYSNILLTGAAASAISGLQASEECYKDAINILKKRFSDERLIVQDHLRGLLDLKSVSSSSNMHQLRRLYDEVQVA
ncbi:uncharacterized protein LOC144175464 [Haemaphysalis longicornis]